MPVMSDKVVYGNLAIKKPATVRMELLKSTILGAKQLLGSMVGGKLVDNVRWGLEVHVCKEGEPDCVTTQHALSIVFSSDRGNNRWLITVYVEDYYVTPSAQFQFEAFKFGQESDVVIDVTFRDTVVNVAFNGRALLDSDLLKGFEQIRTLKANNYFYDPTGTEMTGVGDQYLVYNTRILTPMDVSGIVNTLVPVTVAIGVLTAVFALFKYVIPAIKK